MYFQCSEPYVTSSSIIFMRGQTSLYSIPPKLINSHQKQSRWINSTTGKRVKHRSKGVIKVSINIVTTNKMQLYLFSVSHYLGHPKQSKMHSLVQYVTGTDRILWQCADTNKYRSPTTEHTPRYDGAGRDSVTSGQTDTSGLLLYGDGSSPAAPPVDLCLAVWTAVERADQ